MSMELLFAPTFLFNGEITAQDSIVLITEFSLNAPGQPGAPGEDGEDGREVQLQVTVTHVQWRYEGDVAWTNLIPLADLKGAPGDPGADGDDGAPGTDGDDGAPGVDGREVQLQSNGTFIQWRYVGDVGWTNIVALTALKGDPGDPGTPGVDGDDGAPGADGDDGREVELQTNVTHIQWRYVGDPTWTNLKLLSELQGAPGVDGDDGAPGVDGDDGAPGVDGREVEFNRGTTHIQWRFVGDVTWIDLVLLDDLKGDQGDPGTPAIEVNDLWLFMGGLPAANILAFKGVFGRAVTFPGNFAGSILHASVASTASKVFDVRKNGSSVGSITVAAAGTSATFTSTGGAAVSFAIGDRIEITTPAVQDVTLADVSITLLGTRD